ncbi:MAG TPA: hypothetical protein V6D08_01760 [Candidatus Obscuribacterales bacterium]
MIRLNKPVKLYEWGEGTNTLNQVWNEVGQGRILSFKRQGGAATLVVEMDGKLVKKNQRDNSLKIAQQGEGMTARSERWGEVVMGKLKSVEERSGKSVLAIDVPFAAKVSAS